MIPDRTFTCDYCHRDFDTDRSDEEALAEKEARFPNVPLEDCGVVCEECWIKLGFRPQ